MPGSLTLPSACAQKTIQCKPLWSSWSEQCVTLLQLSPFSTPRSRCHLNAPCWRRCLNLMGFCGERHILYDARVALLTETYPSSLPTLLATVRPAGSQPVHRRDGPTLGTSDASEAPSGADAPSASSMYAPWDDALDEGDAPYYQGYDRPADQHREGYIGSDSLFA